MTTKIGLSEFSYKERTALRNLLHPFDVEFCETNESDLTICRSSSKDRSKPLICISSHSLSEGRIQPTSYGNGVVNIPFDLVGFSLKKYEQVMNPRIALRLSLIHI